MAEHPGAVSVTVVGPRYGCRVTTPDRYEAVWLPGLDSDADPDDALEIALDWLATVPVGGERLIVMYAKKMAGNRALLTWAAQRYRVVSPRSREGLPDGRGNAVLAVWPDGETLELAQRLALDGALCVIPGSLYDVRPWIVRTGAVNLADPDEEVEPLPTLSAEVRKELDSIVFFGGHNSFLGAGEKERAVRGLRRIVAAGHRPAPEAIEAYVLTTGKTGSKGAERLRMFYEGVLGGKNFRDHAGRPI